MNRQEVFARYASYDKAAVREALREALNGFPAKLVVLDDDPTGVQTVHDVYVYTDWSYETLLEGFRSPERVFFILTNSRGMSADETKAAHAEIAANLARASKDTGVPFAVISRSDSTLRGHYPLETLVLRDALERETGEKIDGEILMPFFAEGGRYTFDDVHYVANGEALIPAGETEFARDKTFGYQCSNLRDWIIEKHGGAYSAADIRSIPLDILRARDYRAISAVLDSLKGFQKCIVNAIEYADVEVFATALIRSMRSGKRFLFRTAAALPKVLGGVSDKGLLTREELIDRENRNGGLVIVGSHVKRTTEQLEALRRADFVHFIEFNQHLALDESAFREEQKRVVRETEKAIREGKTVAVYTKRERFDLSAGGAEDQLRLAIRISNAVTGIVASLSARPNFLIAKGGITSSEIGTKGLNVKKALVMGQILPGIPVWRIGPESRFPGMPYVVFPGNVGGESALYEAVLKIAPEV